MTRAAIVTGGTRGIGEAISLALRDMGITVAANYAGNSERAETFTRRTGIRNYKWDVADFYACEAFRAQIADDMCPVVIVVNNAALQRPLTHMISENLRVGKDMFSPFLFRV